MRKMKPSGAICPREVWAQLPPKPESPWNRSRFLGHGAFRIAGLECRPAGLSLQEAVSIGYIHRPAFQDRRLGDIFRRRGVGMVVFLAAVAGFARLAAGFALAALMLSGALRGAGFLGHAGNLVLHDFAVRMIRKRTAGEDAEIAAGRAARKHRLCSRQITHWNGHGRANSAAKLLLIAAIFMVASRSNAEEPPKKDATAASASPVYRVFVPTDAAKKPLGDKVYVPERFYNELYRRAEAVSEKPQGWLLTSAVYRGSLVRESATGQMTLDIAQGAIRSAYVQPRRSRANSLPPRKRRSPRRQRPARRPTRCTSSGKRTERRLLSPSMSRAIIGSNFRFSPKCVMANGRSGFRRLDSAVGRRAIGTAFAFRSAGRGSPSALGKVAQESEPPRIVADLGPDRSAGGRLAGRRNGRGGCGNRRTPLVESAAGFRRSRCATERQRGRRAIGKIAVGGRSAIAVAAAFRSRCADGASAKSARPAANHHARVAATVARTIDHRTFVFDDRRLGRGQSAVAVVRSAAIANRKTLAGSFRRSALVGTAVVQHPPIAPRRTAAEGQPAEQPATKVEASPPTIFSRLGGPPPSAPLAAYRLGAAADWSLSTKPREPLTTAEPALALSFDRERVEIDFTAQLTTASGYVFQYRLLGPKELSVQSVSLKKDGVEMVSRWTHDADGTITVFLTGPAEGRQELKLRGTMPLSGQTIAAAARLEARTSRFRIDARAGLSPARRARGSDAALGRNFRIVFPRALACGFSRPFRTRTSGARLSGRGKIADLGRSRLEAEPPDLQSETTRLAAAGRPAMAGGNRLPDPSRPRAGR